MANISIVRSSGSPSSDSVGSSYPRNWSVSSGSQHLDSPEEKDDIFETSCSRRKVSNCNLLRDMSREVSPMQEELRQEQKWKKTLIKLDEILSDVTAPHKGYFDQLLFVKSFTNKDILGLLFKLFDQVGSGRITQEKLIDSVRVTLTNTGGREWVELLEVLAYVISVDHDVTEEHFIKIFTSKGVVEKLFKYLNRDGEGCVSRQQIMDLIANLTHARPREGFSKENLEWLEKMFREALGTKQELSFDDFKKIVHSQNSFFAERVFEIFDRDKSGSVSLSEFLDAMHQFAGKSPNDKIKFLFRIYDLDGDGLIQREELEQVMKACMEENGMKFSDEQIEDLTLALFEDADTEGRGEITYEALKAQLEKHSGLLENLSIRWLVPPAPRNQRITVLTRLKSLRPYQLTLPYLRNNYVYLCFLSFYISVNLGLFIDRALTIYHKHGNPYYILARASGQCLNFNSSFILVLMLRQSITFLRTHGAAAILPLDQHLYFHKLVGGVVFFFSSLHTVMHLINFPLNVVSNPTFNPTNLSAVQWIFTAEPKLFGLLPGWANPTGVILMAVLIIMVICSMPFVRKSGSFEIFYWTHLFYVVFWTLTILHGPHFWKWFIGPAVLFIIEKVYRTYMLKTGHRKTYISSGILLPSKVIHLVIQKPSGFHYHPGDYVFINIPSIAKYEWHPFTISSAPEQDEAVWLHIRAVGEWTSRLYSYFEKQQLICEKNYTFKKSSVPTLDTKVAIDAENDTTSFLDDQEQEDSKIRRNGVVNFAFEKDFKEDAIELQNVDKDSSSPKDPLPPQKQRAPLSKTTSVPVAQHQLNQKDLLTRDKCRNTSAFGLEHLQNLENTDALTDQRRSFTPSQIVFPTNRSVAMSIRYIRRKPRVITLHMPDDSEVESSTEEESIPEMSNTQLVGTHEIEEPQVSDGELPKPTEVRRGSGRLFHISTKKKSQEFKEFQRRRRSSRLKEAEYFGQCTVGKPLVIYLDGPYGTPSSHIFRAQHAVLIATGIGVTPFASILQSIMHRYLKARQICPRCDHTWISDIPQSVMNLRKVDFFWINRDQRSFEWFVSLLSQLEIEQAELGGILERFLDMHMYITSALQRTDMKAVGLQLALELLHEKEKRDLITGLKTRTNAGRPNWDKVFKQLSNQRKGKITVFYCGPPSLGRSLRYKCGDYGFDFRKEIF